MCVHGLIYKQVTLEECRGQGCQSSHQSPQSKICVEPLTPQKLNYSFPSISVGKSFPGTPMNIKFHGCSSTLYKMAQNNASSQPSAFAGFNPWLVESVDVKPEHTLGSLYIYWKKIPHVSEPAQFKPVLFESQLYIYFQGQSTETSQKRWQMQGQDLVSKYAYSIILNNQGSLEKQLILSL